MNKKIPPQRVMLPTPYSPRDPLREKGGILRNCYTEKGKDLRVVKRPGMIDMGEGIPGTTCLGQGAFFYGDIPVFVGCDSLSVGEPSVVPSCSAITTPSAWGVAEYENAIRDPVTGYIWASSITFDNVKVFDPVTQTVIATIAAPAQTSGLSADLGLAALPSQRIVFVAVSAPLLVTDPNYFGIDMDTYAITRTLTDVVRGGTVWPLIPVHIAGEDEVVIYSANGISLGYATLALVATDPWASTTPAPYPNNTHWTYGAIDAQVDTLGPVPRYALFGWDDGFTVVSTLTPYPTTSYPLPADMGASGNLLRQTKPLAYDGVRKVLWAIDNVSLGLYSVDMAVDGAAQVFKATLPTPPAVTYLPGYAALEYDRYRDVLWALSAEQSSGSSTLYRINPASGVVIDSRIIPAIVPVVDSPIKIFIDPCALHVNLVPNAFATSFLTISIE